MKYNDVHPDYKEELYEELEDTIKNWCARCRVDFESKEDMLMKLEFLSFGDE